jgi:hypothetical protein
MCRGLREERLSKEQPQCSSRADIVIGPAFLRANA